MMDGCEKPWESDANTPRMEGGLQYHIRCGEGDIEKYCLMPGDPERVDMIAAEWDESRFVADNREHRTCTGAIGGIGVSCCSTGAGGGSAASAFEEVANLGADTLIRVGSCGAIADAAECGDLIILTACMRHDGTSDQYIEPAYPAAAHYTVIAALVEAAECLGYPYHMGVGCSTSAWYCGQGRPGFGGYTQTFVENKVEGLRRAGVLCFDMETATLYTLCGLYGLRGGSVCSVFADRRKNILAPCRTERSVRVANLAVRILSKWDGRLRASGKKHWHPSLP